MTGQPANLLANNLGFDARPWPQGQYDGANHSNQQNDARRLERYKIVGVQHPTQGIDIVGLVHRAVAQGVQGWRRFRLLPD